MVKKKTKQLLEDLKEAIEVQDDPIPVNRKPGEKYRVGGKTFKVPWTKKDVEEIYPLVEFIPEETLKMVYQGLGYQLIADRVCKVPSIIRELYVEKRKKERELGRGVYLADGSFEPVRATGAL